jgi:hypothetical protein
VGPGGAGALGLLAAALAYLYLSERRFSRKAREGEANPFAGMPKVSVQMVPAPGEMTGRLTPKWQADFSQKLESEGYLPLGDYSYASTLFFWARTFLSPDRKSALLLVNWVEGKEGGKVVISNLEIYSFGGNSFIVTACAQDGAAKLLTGANRPSEDRMSLHLKAVFAESAARPILQEHQKRLEDWEKAGAQVRILTKENILPSLSKIFS